MKQRNMLVTKHEACTCGHCRCDHHAGFGACINITGMCTCSRYTWPGAGANLPANHKPGAKFKVKQ